MLFKLVNFGLSLTILVIQCISLYLCIVILLVLSAYCLTFGKGNTRQILIFSFVVGCPVQRKLLLRQSCERRHYFLQPVPSSKIVMCRYCKNWLCKKCIGAGGRKEAHPISHDLVFATSLLSESLAWAIFFATH